MTTIFDPRESSRAPKQLTLNLRQTYLRLLYFYRSSKRWLHRSIERISMNIDSVAQSADPLC